MIVDSGVSGKNGCVLKGIAHSYDENGKPIDKTIRLFLVYDGYQSETEEHNGYYKVHFNTERSTIQDIDGGGSSADTEVIINANIDDIENGG